MNNEELEKIAGIMLKEIENRLQEQKIYVEIDSSVAKLISNKDIDKNFGARPLRRIIKDIVENRISEEIINGNIKKEKKCIVFSENDEIKIKMGIMN